MQGPTQTNPCPRCSHQNTADSKYCANCNLHINGICPRCATHNAHSTHFCSSCGLDLAPPTSQVLAKGPGFPIDIKLPTGANPGGIIRRGVAYILDAIIIVAAAVLIPLFLTESPYYEVNNAYSEVVSWAFVLGYPPLVLTLWSTTFGKRPFNLYVVRFDGTSVRFLQALNRETWKYFTAIPLGLTFWFAVFRKDDRALHDLIAGTVVIRR